MKYLKKFEYLTHSEYWSVYTDPYYIRKSLKKVECPDYTIDYIIQNIGDMHPNEILYISFEINDKNDGMWNWSFVEKSFSNSHRYNGFIELSKDEFKEIEIEKQADKFNL